MTKSQSKSRSSGTTEEYKYVEHGPWINVGGKMWCFGCGHVALNNNISRWVSKIGCYFREHPSYRQRLKRIGGHK